MPTTIKFTSNKFPALAKKLPGLARAVVNKTVYDIDGYMDELHLVPVDTGALKNSITVYPAKPGEDPIVGYVATGIEYAEFVEFGTFKMAAQPYMTPAAEAHRRPFEMAVRSALENMDA